MPWKHFQTEQLSIKFWKMFQTFTTVSKNRSSPYDHGNFSAWYWFNQAPTEKILEHGLIDFIHTNAMKLFCLSLLCKLHNNIIIVHIVCGIISTYAPVHVPVSSKIVHESLTRQTSLEVNKNKQNTRHSQFRQNTHSVFNGLWKHLKKFTQSEHEKHGDKKFKI